MAHHNRPANGNINRINSAHHTIQTKTMPKLRLPAGVPNKPVSMASKNTGKVIAMNDHGSQRLAKIRLTSGTRVSSSWDIG
jgi:hypothetical protein